MSGFMPTASGSVLVMTSTKPVFVDLSICVGKTKKRSVLASSTKKVKLCVLDRSMFNLDIGDDIKQPKNARVEYSRSDRGSCMECKQKIPEGSLRVEFKSGYHHPKCLAGQHSYLRLADE